MVEIAAIYYDDIYFREVAQATLEAVAEFDDETLSAVIVCLAYCAEVELNLN